MKQYIIGLDLGTTALKIALFDDEGLIKGVVTKEYDLMTPQASWVEVSPKVYWDSFKAGLSELLEKCNCEASNIKALGISAQGETLFFVDEEGKHLRNAIVWLDNRAQKQAENLQAHFGNETCYKRTGQVSFEACWPSAKILWVKENEPKIFEKTAKFLLIEDYFIYRLCGKYVSEGSLLCSTTYWDIITKKYWGDMLDYIGIDESQLPKIMESGEEVCPISEDIAIELGLASNTIICTGALDQAAGAIGVGNIKEGMFSENIGAALAICVPVSKPTYDPNMCMPLHYFALPNMYMMHTFTNGGMTLRWFRDQFCQLESSIAKLTKEDAYDLISKEANTIPAGCDGLVMLPHLAGSLAPDVKTTAKGVFYGFTLMHTKAHFARAIMESLGYIVKRNIEALSDMGIEVTELNSLGGGSKSSAWNQIKSDILGKKLIITRSEEAACLGAALLAGKAVGIFNSVEEAVEKMIVTENEFLPNEENEKVYETGYNVYKDLFNNLNDMFDKY
jgi:sugar (pentulose or hexulose) kinase